METNGTSEIGLTCGFEPDGTNGVTITLHVARNSVYCIGF
jgi:hypothetical protein